MNGDGKDKKNISFESNDYLNAMRAAVSHCNRDNEDLVSCLLPASSQITANFLVLLKTPGSEAVLSPLLRSGAQTE